MPETARRTASPIIWAALTTIGIATGIAAGFYYGSGNVMRPADRKTLRPVTTLITDTPDGQATASEQSTSPPDVRWAVALRPGAPTTQLKLSVDYATVVTITPANDAQFPWTTITTYGPADVDLAMPDNTYVIQDPATAAGAITAGIRNGVTAHITIDATGHGHSLDLSLKSNADQESYGEITTGN